MTPELKAALAQYNSLVSEAEALIEEIEQLHADEIEALDLGGEIAQLLDATQGLNGLTIDLP